MTPLEEQVTILLGLTGTLNVLDAIDHVKTLKHLLHTTEQQRKEWADMCIKKQARIEQLENEKLLSVLNKMSVSNDSIIEKLKGIEHKLNHI